MTRLTMLLLVVLLPAAAHAQEPTPFRWETHTAIPQRISDAAVYTNIGLDAWEALYRTDARARWSFACRTGLTFGLAEITKRLVHRERPNGVDDKSFYSMHTALATAAAGYNSKIGASLALAVAWGRQAGGMHYGSDVAVGAGIGLLSRSVCR